MLVDPPGDLPAAPEAEEGGDEQSAHNQRVQQHARGGADLDAPLRKLAGDLGCLMNLAGKMKRDGSRIRVRHVAEVLAGMADAPAIGEDSQS